MNLLRLLLSGCIAITVILTACERKLTREQVKDNLEKTMTEYLQNEQPAGAPPAPIRQASSKAASQKTSPTSSKNKKGALRRH